ncbi:hypothetical protein PL78_07240 [Yersinia entomophaga]|uniref:Uncharacterized protein n=1 Tax=Yersinia entomophaga TaxID=935293 RepID=A0ABN4PRK4_YERET|nr:hypothetical protein PL78_07240 [Yersinia entomophaga]OWF87760.1 hypothetical protein B4914_10225 [Yersinia entomophaga]
MYGNPNAVTDRRLKKPNIEMNGWQLKANSEENHIKNIDENQKSKRAINNYRPFLSLRGCCS